MGTPCVLLVSGIVTDVGLMFAGIWRMGVLLSYPFFTIAVMENAKEHYRPASNFD